MTRSETSAPRLTWMTFSLALILAGLMATGLAVAEENAAPEPQIAEDQDAADADSNSPERRWRDSRGEDEEGGDRERRRPMPEELRAREYVEDVMMARLSKALDLDDEESLLLMRRFKEHREESMRLFRERQQNINALREALEAEDEAASVEVLETLLRLDKALSDHRQDLILEPGLELDRMQRARLYVFLADFEEGMRRILRQVHVQRDSEDGSRSPGPPFNRGRDSRGEGEGPPSLDSD